MPNWKGSFPLVLIYKATAQLSCGFINVRFWITRAMNRGIRGSLGTGNRSKKYDNHPWLPYLEFLNNLC